MTEEEFGYSFTPDGETTLLPYGPALVEVAFSTADEGLPQGVPECPANELDPREERLKNLELGLEGIQRSLQQLLGTQVGSAPKSLARPLPQREAPTAAAKPKSKNVNAAVEGELAGLAPEVVQSALAAGIPVEHLREMNSILKSKTRRLDELPRRRPAVKKRHGPLSESEDADEEAAVELDAEEPLDGSGAQGDGGDKSNMEVAIMKLTAIASKLSGPKDSQKLENLLDGGGGAAASSESSGGAGNRKNAAAMRALQKCLREDPKYLYSAMEANVQSDFLARPVQPGEPMPAGATIRGWLTSRSRVQLYHNHVRWTWQVAGIWDALIAGRVEEARARCGLLVAAADQASIDGGNWVLSNVALLEAPPPYQAFSQHQTPGPLEAQHSVIYDHRWAEIFLGHLKDVDAFVDAKKKLGSGKGAVKEIADTSGTQLKAKPKAKAKEKGDRGRKGQESSSQEAGGSTNA